MLPTVSIITAVYNGSRFIGETAQSVLSQVGVPIEWVIIDDASEDNSVDIVESEIARIQAPHIKTKILKRPFNIGSADGFVDGIWEVYDEGLQASSGELFMVLDHDDILSGPDSISKYAQLHQEHPNIAASFSRLHRVDSDGNTLRDSGIWTPKHTPVVNSRQIALNYLFHPRYPFVHSSIMSQRSAHEEIYANRKPRFDTFRLIDALVADMDIGYIDKDLVHYRMHEGNRSHDLEGMRPVHRQSRIEMGLYLFRNPHLAEMSARYWDGLEMARGIKNNMTRR